MADEFSGNTAKGPAIVLAAAMLAGCSASLPTRAPVESGIPQTATAPAAEARDQHHRDPQAAGDEALLAAVGRAADVATQMLGRPYRYGGSSPEAGFDCSGLIQFSFRQAGVLLPRMTDGQRGASSLVRGRDLRRGDLVFFNQEGKRNSHAGIYVGRGWFVHAPSSGKRVRMDRLDSSYWRQHLSEVRRVDRRGAVRADAL